MMRSELTGRRRLLISYALGAALSLVLGWVFPALGSTITYTYDELGRLTGAQYDNGGNLVYKLDPAGNRTLTQSSVDTTPPSIPTGLAGSAVAVNRINLTWSASTDAGSGVAGYRIYRGGSSIGTSPTTSYSDLTVVGSTSYTYTVAAYDYAGNPSGASSAVVVATPDITPPSVPSGLSGSAPNYFTVNLSWSASTDTGGSGLAGYHVYRNGGLVGNASSTSYADTTVAQATTYSYTVSAYDNAGNASAQSGAAPVTTPPVPDSIPPSKPTGLSASGASPTLVNLSWSVSTDTGGSGLAGYKVYKGGSLLTTTSATSYADIAVTGGNTYSYTVSAYDHAGNNSSQSTAATGTTPVGVPPTILGTPNPSFGGNYGVSWSVAPGTVVGHYNLKEQNLTSGGTITYSVTNNAMSFTKGGAEREFLYTVQACTSANVCGAFSTASLDETVCPSAGCL
jgi:fibronectin type 3 domain-containing protein